MAEAEEIATLERYRRYRSDPEIGDALIEAAITPNVAEVTNLVSKGASARYQQYKALRDVAINARVVGGEWKEVQQILLAARDREFETRRAVRAIINDRNRSEAATRLLTQIIKEETGTGLIM